MRHVRTVSRHARFAGYFAGLLALVPVTAFASWSAQITDVRPTGNSTPTHIETRVSSNYRFSANDPRFYNRSLSLVSRQTVRTGALAALSRGVTHPGLALAVAAAGFVISNNQILTLEGDAQIPSDELPEEIKSYSGVLYRYAGSSSFTGCDTSGSYSSSTYSYNTMFHSSLNYTLSCALFADGYYHIIFDRHSVSNGSFSGQLKIRIHESNHSNAQPFPYDDVTNPTYSPVPQSDLSQLDQHLPDVLVREIYQADTYPEPWYESLYVSTLPLSQVSSPNGQAAPEIFEDVAKWAENMTAQVNGEPEPHQGTNVAAGGNTAADQIVESIDENPPDDFPTVDDPVWVVDEIDELPDFDTGLTNYAQCRQPDVIEVPHFGTFELNWQPACDFATNISGPFKALGLLLGMFIVVGRR